MLTLKFWEQSDHAKAFWNGLGDFGEITGTVKRDGNTLTNESDDYRVQCRYEKDECGVFARQDTFFNMSNRSLGVSCLKSRFVFEGGEYEVYTQYNDWQVESSGSWQPLVTSVVASCSSTRTTQNATPFLGLWSIQQQRGVVFHLLPNCAWEIKVCRVGLPGKHTKVLVELGIKSENFSLKVAPREIVQMPQILCYEFKNRIDMECYRLHHYAHTHYPRKQMPVIYNTWMYRFTDITCELLLEQVELAAELGVEYFVIDAGWFGKAGSWVANVGNWSENLKGGLCGRMMEIADKTRTCGMKFGLWLEPERAAEGTDVLLEHREYFVKVENIYMLNFANEEAWRWMLDIVCNLIDHYGVEYIKFDHNSNMYHDVYRNSFLQYHRGHENFIRALRERYSEIYLTGCAGGGGRTELSNYAKFDSFWPSDNQGVYDEMRIYKDTILRLPPQGLEKWVAVHSLKGFEEFYKPFTGYNPEQTTERLISCNDAVWYDLTGVHKSYLEGYMTCCPIGFSCDLKELSPKAREDFGQFINKFKENREFWVKAVARILVDTPSVTAYQYSDLELRKIVIQVFTQKALQGSICIYPEVNLDGDYQLNGKEIVSGSVILEDGIEIILTDWFEMSQVVLEEMQDVVISANK